jgi:hypothetical protein
VFETMSAAEIKLKAPGYEKVLMTVGLILGNKVLDDQ